MPSAVFPQSTDGGNPEHLRGVPVHPEKLPTGRDSLAKLSANIWRHPGWLPTGIGWPDGSGLGGIVEPIVIELVVVELIVVEPIVVEPIVVELPMVPLVKLVMVELAILEGLVAELVVAPLVALVLVSLEFRWPSLVRNAVVELPPVLVAVALEFPWRMGVRVAMVARAIKSSATAEPAKASLDTLLLRRVA